jgi:mannose-1-phosphate guanylyltransferase/phosphomannomutase
MVAGEGTRLHKLIREIPPSVMVRELAPCSWESKGMIMRRLAEDSRGKPTTLIDGIRISYGHDWIIAYPSQTNSYFHLVAEAATEEKGRELITEYSEKIKLWQGEAASIKKNLNV